MARPKRILYENALYHVIGRGNERQKIVRDDKDRWLFLRVLGEAIEEHRILCHAWVLMDNHYHLVVETPDGNLPIFAAHLNGVYTQKFNRRHHRVGHLYQGRYKAIHVDRGIYLQELCRYVVLNPVRAKMVEHPGEWKWSSYRATAGLEKGPDWMETSWILGQFGKKAQEAQKHYRQYVLRDMKRPETYTEKVGHGLYLGGEEFKVRMQLLARKNKNLDIPKYQKMLVRPGMDEMASRVAKVYVVKTERIKERRHGNESRDMLIYLLKKEYGYNLREIGTLGIGFSAVGNRWHLMKMRVAKDKTFGAKTEKCIM